MTDQSTTDRAISSHPLAGYRPETINSWPEWLEAWENAELLELRHSLLHVGLHVPTAGDQYSEQIVFYLKMADQLELQEYLLPQNRPTMINRGCLWQGKPISGIDALRVLANKAFSVLAIHLFKDAQKGYDWRDRYLPAWLKVLEGPEVIETLAWFVRPNQYGWPENIGQYNQRDGHHVQLGQTYVREVCRYLFNHINLNRQSNLVAQRLLKVRPDFLPAVAELDLWRLLLEDPTDLDQACLERLRQVALAPRQFKQERGMAREPVSLEEALWAGSRAAEVLLLIEARAREEQRHQRLKDAAEKVRQAQAEFQKLGGSAKP